ncbi:hypothetical protein VTK56DRAFT_372 [Thermocarpiscus australiensis]
MSSRAETSAGTPAPHACPHCNRVFSRLCDLNKHTKSHSRPYKCKVPSCKYSSLGWPTAKELERHENDRHSPSPRTFACSFQPCPYTSKRESNCKQHMEKAHGWVYVRSKPKGKRVSAQHRVDLDRDHGSKDPEDTAEADRSTSAGPAPPRPLFAPPPGMDFILYDDDQVDAVGEHDGSTYPDYGDSQGPDSYLPWPSPLTRLRKKESFIEMFTQTYNGGLDKAADVDGTDDVQPDSMSSGQTRHDTEGHPQADEYSFLESDAAIKVESPATTIYTFFPRKRKLAFDEASSSVDPNPPAVSASDDEAFEKQQVEAGQTARYQSKSPSGHRQGCGEGGPPPKKKLQPNPAENFTDTSMPDIFRFAGRPRLLTSTIEKRKGSKGEILALPNPA